jgi:hypothetical protein
MIIQRHHTGDGIGHALNAHDGHCEQLTDIAVVDS